MTGKKSAVDLIISILSNSNIEDRDMLTPKAQQAFISIISSLIQESPEAIKQFIAKKGLQELLMMKSKIPIDGFIDLCSISMALLEDPAIIAATLETKVKQFFKKH